VVPYYRRRQPQHVRLARFGRLHALVGPKLPRDLRIRVERPAGVRVERLLRRAACESGTALVELDEGALDLLLVGLLRSRGKRND
jgi:hypothetical protein